MRLKVYVRLRPVSGPGDGKNGIAKPEHRIMLLSDPNKQGNTSEFVFDRIFDAGASQGEIFEEARESLEECKSYRHGVALLQTCRNPLPHRSANPLWNTSCRATMHAAWPTDRQVGSLETLAITGTGRSLQQHTRDHSQHLARYGILACGDSNRCLPAIFA